MYYKTQPNHLLCVVTFFSCGFRKKVHHIQIFFMSTSFLMISKNTFALRCGLVHSLEHLLCNCIKHFEYQNKRKWDTWNLFLKKSNFMMFKKDLTTVDVRQAETYIHQVCANTGCHLEDLSFSSLKCADSTDFLDFLLPFIPVCHHFWKVL